VVFAWSTPRILDHKPLDFLIFPVTRAVAVSYALYMDRSNNRRARAATLLVVVATAALWGPFGLPVHADDEPVAVPPVGTGEVDGAIVAVGPPPVPPTTVVVAVGPPPVPPTTVDALPTQPAPVQPVVAADNSGPAGDQSQALFGARKAVEGVGGVVDAIAGMIATVESAVALIDSRL
jgi:hypothetical protein